MRKLFKREIGITLIALIITIIVMLILVAVTISVALNGGIFNNATDAKTKTQRQAEKEELIAAMVGAYDSTGSFATSNVGTLPSGARWCTKDIETWEDAEDLEGLPTGNGDWIITTNNNKFYIDESGSVLDEKPQTIPLQEDWDGTYNGVQMPSTDYWYEIEIKEINKTYSGHFTLIRQ